MKNVKLVIPMLLILVIACGSSMALAGSVPAVLDQLPADSMAVVASQPLSGIFAKASKAAEQYGIVPPDSQLNLGEMLSAQLAAGFGTPVKLDTSKGIGVSIMNAMMAEKTFIIFLPVEDSTALINAVTDKEAAGEGIWKLKFGPHVRASKNYLIMADNAEILVQQAGFKKGFKLTESQAELFKNSDVAATIGLTQLLPMAKMMAQGFLAGNAEIQSHTSLSTILTKTLDRLGELESAGMGVLLSDAGVNLKINLQAQKGTVLADYLSDHPKLGSAAIGTLPAGDFFTAVAINFSPKLYTDVLKAITNAITADPKLNEYVSKDDIAELNSLIDEAVQVSVPTIGANYIFSDTGKSGVMNMGTITRYKNNCSKIPELSSKLLPLMSKIIKTASGEMQLEIPMTYTRNTGEANYDQMVIDFSKLPVPPEVIKMLSSAYGGEAKFNMYMKSSGKNAIISSMDKDIMAKTADLLKSSAKLSSNSAVANYKKNAPPTANYYCLIDMGTYMKVIAETMQSQMKAMGAEGEMMMGPIGMMSNLAGQIKGAIGTSGTMEKGCSKTDIYISADFIKSAVKTGQMAIGMMMGGGMNASPNQPAPSNQPPMF